VKGTFLASTHFALAHTAFHMLPDATMWPTAVLLSTQFHLLPGPVLRFTLQPLLTFISDLCSSAILCRVYW